MSRPFTELVIRANDLATAQAIARRISTTFGRSFRPYTDEDGFRPADHEHSCLVIENAVLTPAVFDADGNELAPAVRASDVRLMMLFSTPFSARLKRALNTLFADTLAGRGAYEVVKKGAPRTIETGIRWA